MILGDDNNDDDADDDEDNDDDFDENDGDDNCTNFCGFVAHSLFKCVSPYIRNEPSQRAMILQNMPTE